jgi:hypothetical protein
MDTTSNLTLAKINSAISWQGLRMRLEYAGPDHLIFVGSDVRDIGLANALYERTHKVGDRDLFGWLTLATQLAAPLPPTSVARAIESIDEAVAEEVHNEPTAPQWQDENGVWWIAEWSRKSRMMTDEEIADLVYGNDLEDDDEDDNDGDNDLDEWLAQE